MIFIDAFFSFAAGGRHHLAVMRLFGNFVAVIRRLRRGYEAIALRLLGINLALMRLSGGVDAVIGQLRCGYWASPGGDAVIRTRRTERWGVCPKKRIRLTWAGALVGLILIIKSRRLLYLVDGFLDALEY